MAKKCIICNEEAKFKIKDTDQEIIIASTRPELLCACRTVIVNPEDERYSKYIGKKIIVPITNAEVELITHNSAKQEFGSGAVMVCSYGDQNDVALFRELQLEEIVAIGLDGRMTEVAGEYTGLKPKQARTKIIEDLETAGFVEKIDDNTMTIKIPDTEITDKYDYKHWIWSSHTLKFSWNNTGHLLLEVI